MKPGWLEIYYLPAEPSQQTSGDHAVNQFLCMDILLQYRI